MRKKGMILLLSALMLISSALCGKAKESEQSLSGSSEVSAKLSRDMESWLQAANLNAEETPKELYKKALSEETLVVYSNSTRIMDVKESFEKQYPGLTVYVEDIRSVNLIETLYRNYQNKDYLCDIVFCDDNGVMSQDLVPKGIIFKYIPYDMEENLIAQSKQELLPVVIELQQPFYNSEIYDSPPIHNWWELTEEKYRNKVVMSSPLKSISTMGFYSMLIKNSDIMAEAYYDLYGKELALQSGESAGEAFWRMMIENGLILVNSSDEVVEMVGAPGQTDPPIGIMISSKIRMRELGYEIQPIFDMDYFIGTFSANCIMITGGCKNVNSAKLFTRWILGETDGQGVGYTPYLQNGAWSARTDVQSKSDVQLDDVEWLDLDTEYIYANQKSLESFFDKLLSERSKDSSK